MIPLRIWAIPVQLADVFLLGLAHVWVYHLYFGRCWWGMYPRHATESGGFNQEGKFMVIWEWDWIYHVFIIEGYESMLSWHLNNSNAWLSQLNAGKLELFTKLEKERSSLGKQWRGFDTKRIWNIFCVIKWELREPISNCRRASHVLRTCDCQRCHNSLLKWQAKSISQKINCLSMVQGNQRMEAPSLRPHVKQIRAIGRSLLLALAFASEPWAFLAPHQLGRTTFASRKTLGTERGLPLAAASSNVEIQDVNLFGKALEPCTQGDETVTGWTRSGSCSWEANDLGFHQVCVKMSSKFLDSSAKFDRNDLSSVVRDGGHWCICAWAWASAVSRDPKGFEGLQLDCDRTNGHLRDVYRSFAANGQQLASPSGAKYQAQAALEAVEELCKVGWSFETWFSTATKIAVLWSIWWI